MKKSEIKMTYMRTRKERKKRERERERKTC